MSHIISIDISRDEGEWLVDLLETADPAIVGNWRMAIAADIRKKFGMRTYEEEQEYKRTHASQA